MESDETTYSQFNNLFISQTGASVASVWKNNTTATTAWHNLDCKSVEDRLQYLSVDRARKQSSWGVVVLGRPFRSRFHYMELGIQFGDVTRAHSKQHQLEVALSHRLYPDQSNVACRFLEQGGGAPEAQKRGNSNGRISCLTEQRRFVTFFMGATQILSSADHPTNACS